jgi:signal transduction histidine kinase
MVWARAERRRSGDEVPTDPIAAMARSADRVVGAMAGVAALLGILVVGADPVRLPLLALALAPWAIDPSGRRLGPAGFATATLAPVSVLVVLGGAKPVLFLVLATATWVGLRADAVALDVAVVGAGVVLVLGAELPRLAEEDPDAGAVMIGVGTWVAGMLCGNLAGYAMRQSRLLAEELRTAHDRLVAAAASDERRRIAQDVHDLVAHSLGVVLLNVGGARTALTRDPALADEALGRAERVGRESLDGIRHVVGLLHADRPLSPTTGPLPDAHDLLELVGGYRRSGLEVDLVVDGPLDRVDPVAGSVLFRIVREALANVSHHADGADTSVQVTIGRQAVDVVVGNSLAPGRARSSDRTGLGLAGLAERVQALGGRFSAGPDHSGAVWQVVATVPLHRTGTPTSSRPGTAVTSA